MSSQTPESATTTDASDGDDAALSAAVTPDVTAGAAEPADPVRASTDDQQPAAGDRPSEQLLEREGDVAADYLEVLLDIADLDGDIDIDVENGRAAVSVVGSGLNALIGPGGATLEALQELTRLAVHRETGTRSRLMLDVGGHRAGRREELTALGAAAAARVVASGEPERLAPMSPFERKVVHDAVSAAAGVRSESEGEEPQRRIVVHPA